MSTTITPDDITEWTPERARQVRDLLARTPHLSEGLGTAERPCSIAAINLAVTGDLTDDCPACMSLVTHQWIITMQDLMPDWLRDSAEWRGLLPRVAGTGTAHESERLGIIMDDMWTALATVQPVADERGYGRQWATMLTERTTAAVGAAYAADAAAVGAAADAYAATDAYAANAYAAARAARAAARAASYADVWQAVDPVGTLRRLIEVSA